MLSYLQLIRPLNCAMAAAAVYIGSAVATASPALSAAVAYAMLSSFLICAGGMAINDFFDHAADKINRPRRPVASGRVSRAAALAFSLALFAAGIALAYQLNQPSFYLAGLAAALLISYAAVLKRIPLAGNMAVSALVALTFLYGSYAAGSATTSVLYLAALAFLSNTGREIYKSIEDVLGDEKTGTRTLPVRIGVVRAKMVASLFIISAVTLSFLPYLMGTFGAVYLFIVILADIVFLFSIVAPLGLRSTACKAGMVIALFGFFAGAVKL